MSNVPGRDRRRRAELRECLPRVEHIVDELAPRILENSRADWLENIPSEWRAVFDAMADEVRAKVEADREYDADLSLEERYGYEWSLRVPLVERCVGYMMRLIREQIGLKEGAETLASMILVNRALEQLHLELHDAGTKAGREDAEENAVRVYRAIRVLTPRFDDVALRRLRALRVVEGYAPDIFILDDAEVDAAVARMRGHAKDHGEDFGVEEEARQRKWFRSELPMMKVLSARTTLAECDSAFAQLDPLVMLEELADAGVGLKGGRGDRGDGKTGPARALARLAVMCGALEYKAAPDETFDDAVDRVRANLHTTRSRLRDEMRGFPGLIKEPETNQER